MSECVSVIAVVEGRTEQRFVEEVLAPYLANRGVYMTATQVRKKGQNGGDVRFARVRTMVHHFLKQRSDTIVVSFVDYYGISEWPALDEVRRMANASPCSLAEKLNSAAIAEVQSELVDVDVSKRYIPFMAVHEFESLLFSDANVLSSELGIPLQTISATLAECGSPELINNHPETAPSKRLEKWTGGRYRKTTQGIVIAQKIGVDAMRKACPNFDDWLLKVEAFRQPRPQVGLGARR